MARMLRSLAVSGIVAGLGLAVALATGPVAALGQDATPSKGANLKKKGKATKGKAAAPTPAPEATAPSDGAIKFSRDVAPILVANCVRCHDAKHRSKLDQTTFASLMKGGKSGPAIESGDPDDSLLVHRIKGEDGPKMPPGQNSLGEGAIAKIRQWIKEGAKLDAGNEPGTPIAKYAASPEDLRKAELSKLPAAERDKKTEAAALERLRRADPKVNPEITASPHFLLFAEMPKDRASTLLKTMEAQYARVARLVAGTKGIPGPEKIGLYVFKERKGYTEFVRTVENTQDIEPDDEARAKLNVESPYLLAVDPVAGGPEPSASTSKKGGRSKKADDGPARTLAGLLSEQLAAGALAGAGKPPRWLTMGVGALVASPLERGSPYYRRLRADALEQCREGWPAKAAEALGDQTKPETVRAVGFAIAEWISSYAPAAFPYFVKGMLDGGEKLDEVIGQCLNCTRDQFLAGSGEFVMGQYGGGR